MQIRWELISVILHYHRRAELEIFRFTTPSRGSITTKI